MPDHKCEGSSYPHAGDKLNLIDSTSSDFNNRLQKFSVSLDAIHEKIREIGLEKQGD